MDGIIVTEAQSRANDGRCCRGISDQYSVLSNGVVFVDVARVPTWKRFRSSVICNHIPVQCVILRSSALTVADGNPLWLTDVIVDHQVRTYTTMQNSPLMNDNPALTQSITYYYPTSCNCNN